MFQEIIQIVIETMALIGVYNIIEFIRNTKVFSHKVTPYETVFDYEKWRRESQDFCENWIRIYETRRDAGTMHDGDDEMLERIYDMRGLVSL